MTTLIRQCADDDCTLCCIAMATGLPYERVLAVASQSSGGYRCYGKPGTMSPKGVLIDLGFAAQRIPMEAMGARLREGVLFGRRAILSVPSLNGFAGHHDIYWDGDQILDPSNQQTYSSCLRAVSPMWATVIHERR